MWPVVYVITLLLSIVNCQDCQQEKQIKTERVQIWYVNREFCNQLRYDVISHNETYNNIGVVWDLIQDLPHDIAVYIKIFATDASGRGGKKLLDVEMPICSKEGYEIFKKVSYINLNEKQCIKKGFYRIPDIGQIRYEHIIPDIETQGKYFRSDYIVGTPTVTILEASAYAKWGYANLRFEERRLRIREYVIDPLTLLTHILRRDTLSDLTRNM